MQRPPTLATHMQSSSARSGGRHVPPCPSGSRRESAPRLRTGRDRMRPTSGSHRSAATRRRGRAVRPTAHATRSRSHVHQAHAPRRARMPKRCGVSTRPRPPASPFKLRVLETTIESFRTMHEGAPPLAALSELTTLTLDGDINWNIPYPAYSVAHLRMRDVFTFSYPSALSEAFSLRLVSLELQTNGIAGILEPTRFFETAARPLPMW
ncbi:hypothetical protein C8Q76DRAFT_16118 [Earliella scabrosa]|nr:hypothetical protein C8Q76DRAFT_16118 [Earliella scabrosa]